MNIWIFLILFLIAMPLFILGVTQAFGQTNTTPVIQPQVVTTSSPSGNGTDLTLGAGGIGAAAVTGLITLWQQGKLKRADKSTDVDVAKAFAYLDKYFQYAYILDPKAREILDSPVDNAPLNSHVRLGMKMHEEFQGWVDYLPTIGVPKPNMGIAATPLNPASDAAAAKQKADTATAKENTAA